MGDIVSSKKLYIDYSRGNKQLRRVKSGGVTYESSKDVVVAIGVRGGAGFRKKQGGGELTLEVYRETGDQEVNWRQLFDTDEIFAMTFQDEGDGLRDQFRSCTVAQIPDHKYDDNGEVMDSVKIKFLQSGSI